MIVEVMLFYSRFYILFEFSLCKWMVIILLHGALFLGFWKNELIVWLWNFYLGWFCQCARTIWNILHFRLLIIQFFFVFIQKNNIILVFFKCCLLSFKSELLNDSFWYTSNPSFYIYFIYIYRNYIYKTHILYIYP